MSSYWPVFWKHKTNKGKVVYRRKQRPWSWKSVVSVFRSRGTESLPELDDDLRKDIIDFSGALLEISLVCKYRMQEIVRNPKLTFQRQLTFYPVFEEAVTNFVELLEMMQPDKIQQFVDKLLDLFSHFVDYTGEQTQVTTGGKVRLPAATSPAIEKRELQRSRR